MHVGAVCSRLQDIAGLVTLAGNPMCYDCSDFAALVDILVKGAAGQALQNLNIMMGQADGTALMQQASRSYDSHVC